MAKEDFAANLAASQPSFPADKQKKHRWESFTKHGEVFLSFAGMLLHDL